MNADERYMVMNALDKKISILERKLFEAKRERQKLCPLYEADKQERRALYGMRRY